MPSNKSIIHLMLKGNYQNPCLCEELSDVVIRSSLLQCEQPSQEALGSPERNAFLHKHIPHSAESKST